MHVNEQGVQLCQQGCPLTATMQDGQARQARVFLHHAAGHRLPVMVHAQPIRDDDGNIIGAVETFTDNSELFNVERRASHMVRQVEEDALTGVGSRRITKNRLAYALHAVIKDRADYGILFMDIDHFKQVNDTYGHAAGDQVLKMIANTLHHNLRTDDFIGRWGGEEFLAILAHVKPHSLPVISDKLRLLAANSSLNYDDQIIKVTLSIGATRLRSNDALESALQRADELMYQSKKAGRNRVTWSD
jgi:diguanylate cyclase (GGDEF)-like protein